ncbi:hypothetical protein IG631_21332 [Alternaria alternata]|nr:hypothetical protein IG631_21332 [Alternaria alternata]
MPAKMKRGERSDRNMGLNSPGGPHSAELFRANATRDRFAVTELDFGITVTKRYANQGYVWCRLTEGGDSTRCHKPKRVWCLRVSR